MWKSSTTVVAKTTGSSASVSNVIPVGVIVERKKQDVFSRIPELPSSFKFQPCTTNPTVGVHSSIKASRFYFIDQAYFLFA